MIITPVSQETQ